jgi:hypothetical protein
MENPGELLFGAARNGYQQGNGAHSPGGSQFAATDFWSTSVKKSAKMPASPPVLK